VLTGDGCRNHRARSSSPGMVSCVKELAGFDLDLAGATDPRCGLTDDFRAVLVCTPRTDSGDADAMRKALYGRKLWETMTSHWPTADQQPGATPAEIEFAHRWQDMPKVAFSSTTQHGRLEHPPGHRRRGHRDHPAQGRGWRPHGHRRRHTRRCSHAGRADRRVRAGHHTGLGGSGTPFFTALDNWVNLNLVETRTFPDGVVLTRYETRH
jgi:dihydrofolate reductase